jgi:hypothetical protein
VPGRWIRVDAAWRRAAALVAATVIGALVLAPAAADARRDLPPQGLYEYCMPIDGPATCLDRLDQIGHGGFSLVLNYAQLHTTRSELLDYALAAQRLGVKVIWPLKAPAWWRKGGDPARKYPALAAACGCSSRADLLRWFVDLVNRLPATWGYYVGDETSPDNRRAVAALGDRLHALDPNHPRLFIAQGYHPNRDLTPFAPAANVLGVDWYPIGFDLPLSTVSTVSGKAARIARDHGRASAIVLQSFNWASYPEVGAPDPRWPRRGELRAMRNRALAAAKPRLLRWYSYFDIAQSGDPLEHWRDLLQAAFGRHARGLRGGLTRDSSVALGSAGRALDPRR